MTELVNINDDSNRLLQGIERLIEQTGRQVAVYLNTTISRLYWAIGNHIVTEMDYDFYSGYGTQILATLSRRLTEKFGKGYAYSALPDKQWFIDKLNKSIAIAQQSVAREDEKELAGKVLDISKNEYYGKYC
jgi:hypothetical protein